MTSSSTDSSNFQGQTFLGAWIDSTRWFWGLLLLVNAWKSFAAWKLGLIFDECYYWEWSLHPQLCYFDHPPLTAWLIASTHALGHSTLTVRFWALISGILLVLAGRALAREMFGAATGNRAGIFLLLAPILAGNALLMTPDSFLIPAWAFAVLFAWRGNRENGAFVWWLAAGAAAGIGMLSKYTMVLFYGALALHWLLSPGKRIRLFLGISTAATVSLLFFLPVVWWNSQHDWISFEHQIHHGFHNEHQTLVNFGNLLSYIAFLIVLVSPLLGLFCFRSATTKLADERYRFLALFYWTVVLFFAFSALKAHIEANWPMPAFVTGLILVAADWERYGKIWQRAAIILLLIADFGAVLTVGYFSLPKNSPLAIQNLSISTSWIKNFPGSEKLASSVQQGFSDFQARIEEFLGPETVAHEIRKKFSESGADFLCLSTYQLAGVISFYTPELESKMWLPYLGRERFPWINDHIWAGTTALSAEWPRSGLINGDIFASYTPAGTLIIPEIKCPVIFWMGKGYDPKKIQSR